MEATRDNAKFHIILVQAVAFKDGRALIAQRSHDELQSPGLWALPGGKVELYGDDTDVIEKTLQAEFMEEVGIKLKLKMDYLRSGSFIRKDGSSVVSMSFIADWESGEAEALEDSIAVAWVSLDELANYEIAPKVEEKIVEAFKRRRL